MKAPLPSLELQCPHLEGEVAHAVVPQVAQPRVAIRGAAPDGGLLARKGGKGGGERRGSREEARVAAAGTDKAALNEEAKGNKDGSRGDRGTAPTPSPVAVAAGLPSPSQREPRPVKSLAPPRTSSVDPAAEASARAAMTHTARRWRRASGAKAATALRPLLPTPPQGAEAGPAAAARCRAVDMV